MYPGLFLLCVIDIPVAVLRSLWKKSKVRYYRGCFKTCSEVYMGISQAQKKKSRVGAFFSVGRVTPIQQLFFFSLNIVLESQEMFEIEINTSS